MLSLTYVCMCGVCVCVIKGIHYDCLAMCEMNDKNNESKYQLIFDAKDDSVFALAVSVAADQNEVFYYKKIIDCFLFLFFHFFLVFNVCNYVHITHVFKQKKTEQKNA